jgi:hypothetical protein
MSGMIFINTFVQDVAASRAFFSSLGFSFNDTFSDENDGNDTAIYSGVPAKCKDEDDLPAARLGRRLS